MNVRLVFDEPTQEQMDHIISAERELSAAGVSFDSGSDFEDGGKIISHDWELDWSLKGARILVAKPISRRP